MDMKLAVSASGKTLDSAVDPRFGRCTYFIIVETEDMSYEAIPNESAEIARGAGIDAVQSVASAGTEAVITGNVGPKATRALQTAGIEMVTGEKGTVRQAVEAYKAGRLKGIRGPQNSAGVGRGGRGRGRGIRRGTR
jgi:predicted Fe-Mo cluster-binding NifX family protein